MTTPRAALAAALDAIEEQGVADGSFDRLTGWSSEHLADAILAALASQGYAVTRSEAGLEEDGRKWRAAEAEGHIVTFTADGYGLMHPPSCRPDLIGCWFNVYLADLDGPDDEPGRYRMTRRNGAAEYARLAADPEPSDG